MFPAPQPCSVGARGVEPRVSCSQGTRITVFLDADPGRPPPAREFGEKDSNLHRLGQSQAAYRLADPRVVLFSVTPAVAVRFGEKDSNPHRQFQRLPAYR